MTKGTSAQLPDEPIHVSREQWIASCRRQAMEEGKMSQDEYGRYYLTEKGMKTVEKELGRYMLRPMMAVMIEQYFLQQHGILVD